jgi:ABC-type phosphate transport system auxiliary subunit
LEEKSRSAPVFNPRRHRLLAGFQRACEELRRAGCRLVYLNGSFATAPVVRYQTQKSELQEKIGALRKDLDQLKIERKTTPKHVGIKDLPRPGTVPAPIAGT